MNAGDRVRLSAYGNAEIVRRVVDVHGGVVLVCKEESYLESAKVGSKPSAVGFPVEAVIEVMPSGGELLP